MNGISPADIDLDTSRHGSVTHVCPEIDLAAPGAHDHVVAILDPAFFSIRGINDYQRFFLELDQARYVEMLGTESVYDPCARVQL